MLDDGTEIPAETVLSNADPKRTFLGLLDAAALPADFREAVRGIRMDGPCAKVNLVLAEERTACLATLEPGEEATVVRISDAEPEMLRYLAARAIVPGTRVRVVDKQPFGGPLFVEVEGETHALGGQLTTSMMVSV